MPKKKRFFFVPVFAVVLFAVFTAGASEVGIKTSYKQYRIFKHEKGKILCDPYTVQKDDWLYKIFRRKGVISNTNFPLFIAIFSKINPKVKNIDLIAPDEHILIPLKIVQKHDYIEGEGGFVEVPVIEYENMPESFKPYYKKHKVNIGDTLSELIDKSFLNEDGTITPEGIRAFTMANPKIKNIDLIYRGSFIYLPDAEVRSKEWFKSYFPVSDSRRMEKSKKKRSIPELNKVQELQLKKYATLIEGTLLSSGSLYFPGEDNEDARLNLASTPVIKLKSGKKLLIMPEAFYNENVVDTIRQYWEDLEIQRLSYALREGGMERGKSVQGPAEKLNDYKAFIKEILLYLGIDYTENFKMTFYLGSIELNVILGKISRENSPDLLLDFGRIYGDAFDAIKKRGYDIITIYPQSDKIESLKRLFEIMDISSWFNPSFVMGRKIFTLKGLYVSTAQREIFIAGNHLTKDMAEFLDNREIKIFSIFVP